MPCGSPERVDVSLAPRGAAVKPGLSAVPAAISHLAPMSSRHRAVCDPRGRGEAGDHRAHQFLQWFIDEQVEEERTMRALLDLLASGINLFQAQELLAEIVGE